MPKKIDPETIKELRFILSKLNISNNRVTIDFAKDTIEVEEETAYNVDDIIDSAGALTAERAAEMQAYIKSMREEWDDL